VHPINPEQQFGLQASAAEDPKDLSATSENVLTPLERVFLAGLLDHLPAACAFTLPIRASYARMVDEICSGGTWIAWGTHNRETPVRLCVPPTYPPPPAQTQPLSANTAAPTAKPPSGNHFEVKCVDGTSSPYLAFSGLLGAGLLGIQSRSPLIEKDCRATAATMTEAQREAVCVKRRLPRTWEEARGALEGDVAMRDLLGGVVEGFLAVGEVSHSFAAFQSIVFADADLVNRPWMGFYTPLRVKQRECRCSSKIIDGYMIPLISELPNF
jgi:glutamine synthetase